MRKYKIVDAFTDTQLEGNPVAVFLDGTGLPVETMQRIAREMNLSETTFVLPAEDDGDVRVRIFTPVNELPFAGHPTLGTAVAIGDSVYGHQVSLETKVGTIPFDLSRVDGQVVSARMQQPIPTWTRFEHQAELLDALGVERSTLPVEIYRNGPRHVYVGLPSIDALSAVNPDHRALGRFPDLAVNCFAGERSQWRMRMFSPAYGVVEDAATGSAAGPLALHLVRHGVTSAGEQIEILQGVEMGRTSAMYSRVACLEDKVESIEVGGSGVTTAEGVLLEGYSDGVDVEKDHLAGTA